MGLGVGGDEVLDEGGEGVLLQEFFECHGAFFLEQRYRASLPNSGSRAAAGLCRVIL